MLYPDTLTYTFSRANNGLIATYTCALTLRAMLIWHNINDNQTQVVHTLECRCGDMYVVYEEDIADAGGIPNLEIITACNGCSRSKEIAEPAASTTAATKI